MCVCVCVYVCVDRVMLKSTSGPVDVYLLQHIDRPQQALPPPTLPHHHTHQALSGGDATRRPAGAATPPGRAAAEGAGASPLPQLQALAGAAGAVTPAATGVRQRAVTPGGRPVFPSVANMPPALVNALGWAMSPLDTGIPGTTFLFTHTHTP